MKNLKPVILGTGAFIYSLLTVSIAFADDTEIYVPKDLAADQYVRPNILFVLDSSGSMGSSVGKTGKTRNQVLKGVVNGLIDDLKLKEDVNIGFMRYNQNTRGDGTDGGGYILSPVQRLTNANAATMQGVVNAIPAGGNTPLLETYYESYLYMAGKNRLWGAWAPGSVAESRNGETYISPIEHTCQKSHIIYVTDGEPTNDTGSNAAVKALSSKNTLYPAASCGTGQGQCLPHLAEFMANQDLMPFPTPFPDPTDRKQTVTSHFVGFTVNLPLLKNAATAGGGSYYTSDNVSGLTDALKAIITDITADNTSFAAPSVAVSAYNNLGYRDDLYYALFRPAEGSNWPGNIKGYKLAQEKTTDPLTGKDVYTPLILDKLGNPAIDSSTGFFKAGTSSYWSSSDGVDVAIGGAAGQLPAPASRNIFTWTAADRTPGAGSGISGSASLESFTSGNTGVTEALLGAPAGQRSRYIDWARGYVINPDGTTSSSSRKAIGDILHNEPRLVAYVTDENLTRAKDPAKTKEQLYLFFGDNEGFIRAIDTKTGVEKFAFLPKELLANPGAYYRNAKGSINKRYGVDGLFAVDTEYGAESGQSRKLDKAWLYAGMRRGGSSYYALDVTDVGKPQLKWLIKGPQQTVDSNGIVTNASTGFTLDYAKLGRTFSAPILANIMVGTTKTKVLVFSGGYDLDQDRVGSNVRKPDDVGNALFIVNADTGKLIWSASDKGADLNLPTMKYSMPATPALVDFNRDGLVDIIYANDLGGQLFRFDLNSSGTGQLATGGLIASLGGDDAANNRRFFASPDVAYFQEPGKAPYFTIAMGTGFRESPLNTDTNDRFYVLRDKNVTAKPTTYEVITEDKLVDASGVNLSTAQSQQILDDIQALENKMTVLNDKLNARQYAFKTYKESIGFTGKVDAMDVAFADVNDKQRQIDLLIQNTGPYITEHAAESYQQSQLQQALTRARDVLASVEQARANAQTLADASNAVTLAAAAASAATALTAAQTDYTTAKGIADSDAATAATKDATATASEAAAATALTAFNTALANKNAADAAVLAANVILTAKQAVQTSANTALSDANGVAAAALLAKGAADTAYTTASDAAGVALTTWSAADSASTLADSAKQAAQAAKNAADLALGTANDNVLAAQTALGDASGLLDAATADVLVRQGAVSAANTALSTAQGNAGSALAAFNSADAALNAAIDDVAAKQVVFDNADSTYIAAQAALDDDIANNGGLNAAALTIARDNAEAARDSASAQLATATAAVAPLQTAKDGADSALTAANSIVSTKQTEKNAADAALVTSNGLAATALSDKNLAATALGTATTDAASALSAKNDADFALGTAITNAANALTAKNDAAETLTVADAAAASKLIDKNTADNAFTTASDNASDALNAKNIADGEVVAAAADVTAKQDAQNAAVIALASATGTRDSTAATAATDRAASNAAAATAASTASTAASKLTAQNAAQAAKDAADLASTNAVTDDTAAAALTVQRDRMAANYKTLVTLQSDLDTAYAGITAQENAINAAKADPTFDTDLIPAMETALLTARTNYAALATVAKRTALNAGSPTAALALLNNVNAALAAGNATVVAAALNTSLTSLEGGLGAPGALAPTTVSQLLARDEASKNTALLTQANDEKNAVAKLASLTADIATLQADAVVLKADSEALAALAYVPASNVLDASQLAIAQAKYGADLTMFEAYTYLIDLALAASNDPVTGLNALRKQINDNYTKLTIGNSYTPNIDLLDNMQGFYLRLVKGEKVVVDSTSFRGALLFVTFTPRGTTSTACGSDVGRARLYGLSLKDGSAIFTETVNGTTQPVRSFDLKRSGYAPTPSIVFTPKGPVIVVGTEVINLKCAAGFEKVCSDKAMESTYWREQ